MASNLSKEKRVNQCEGKFSTQEDRREDRARDAGRPPEHRERKTGAAGVGRRRSGGHKDNESRKRGT